MGQSEGVEALHEDDEPLAARLDSGSWAELKASFNQCLTSQYLDNLPAVLLLSASGVG